jgi:cadmium resistance protein CadD (predicted permease)
MSESKDREFFLNIFFGTVLGIAGNLLVEYYIQIVAPEGLSQIEALIGFVPIFIALVYFFYKIRPGKQDPSKENEKKDEKGDNYYL